jgi:REP element-mobilizing transposase RayT
MCMDKNGLTHARTCVYNVNYHMVWSVKYRRWNSSFYVETVGSVSEEAIKQYIEHQKTKG